MGILSLDVKRVPGEVQESLTVLISINSSSFKNRLVITDENIETPR